MERGRLCVGRNWGESVEIGDVTVTVVKDGKRKIRLLIEAPKNVRIMRTELLKQADSETEPIGRRNP